MEDRLPRTSPAQQWFQCPGESRPIERAVHLSRLATFDPLCLGCPERHDTTGLSRATLAARAELECRTTPGWQWTADGPSTSERGPREHEFVRRFSFALADILWCAEREPPCVHVGAGSSPRAMELLADLCQALELAGCQVCEVGTVSAPCLAEGIKQSGASGGIWSGNASGRPHEFKLLAWGREGLPWSQTGRLDEIRARVAAGAVRPRRSGGSLRRFDAAGCYVSRFRHTFHGLRALTFVLHTAARSMADYLDVLCGETALRVLRLHEFRPATRTVPGDWPDNELAAIAAEVVLTGAHFGFWADGAGQRCALIDERGEFVAHHRLSNLLACAIDDGSREPSDESAALVRGAPEQFGNRALAAPPISVLGDNQGHHWFAGRATPDALAVLCVLLAQLSRSDRPLSEVLDSTAPA